MTSSTPPAAERNLAGWRTDGSGKRIPIARSCSLCKQPESSAYFVQGLWLCSPCYQRDFYQLVSP